MNKYIIVSHAHHAKEGDAGVYHLVYAEAVEAEGQESVLIGHQEIVWDAGDLQWDGRKPEEIAAEQRSIVRDMLAQRAAETEQAQIEAQAARTDLGGAGQEL